MKTDLIRHVSTEDDRSWDEKVFLTIDIDWASDPVLEYTIDILEETGIRATWFVTHETPLLDRMRSNERFELGIHPNFNPLLNNERDENRDASKIVDNLLEIVPEATSVRSHSMLQSTRLLEVFSERGLTHDCNHFIPEQAGVTLRPWRLWNRLIKVPYFWEDDLYCLYENNTEVEYLLKRKGIKVFDFHPIHIYLNTESLDRYEEARTDFNNPERLASHRFEGFGTKSILDTILKVVS